MIAHHGIEQLLNSLGEIETALGVVFQDRSLLVSAFVHRSYINENRQIVHHNERLEFLGDAILGYLIAEYLYHQLPDAPEGDLSNLRSKLVKGTACVMYVQKLNVEKYLLLGKGERLNDGKGRESILADLFEAIIAAIFLDGGIAAVQTFFFRHFFQEVESFIKMPTHNCKALLQEYTQKYYHQQPHYRMINEDGPDHNKVFCVAVNIGENELGRGYGASKKEAQQASALDAISRLNIRTE